MDRGKVEAESRAHCMHAQQKSWTRETGDGETVAKNKGEPRMALRIRNLVTVPNCIFLFNF